MDIQKINTAKLKEIKKLIEGELKRRMGKKKPGQKSSRPKQPSMKRKG